MKLLAIGTAVVLSSLVLCAQASADSVAYTCRASSSGNGSIKAVWGRGGCVGYVVTDPNGRVRVRGKLGFGGSGQLLLAPDGRTVVFIQSNPYASLRSNGTFQQYGVPSAGKPPPLVGVAVYRGRRLVAKHALADLLGRTRMVSLSTSHVRWLAGKPVVSKRSLSLTTTSMRELRIDLRSGKLSARDSAQWRSCAAIAYGPIRPRAGRFEMKPAHWAKGGTGKSAAVFSAAPGFRAPRGYHTVCLIKRGAGWHLRTLTRYPLLNGLTL